MQNIETEISEFDKHLRQKKVVADNTRIEYSRRARKFLSHINGHDICEPVILDYLEGLKKKVVVIRLSIVTGMRLVPILILGS